jgi:hypothetical protein
MTPVLDRLNPDRVYSLLPAVIRARDEEAGGALRSLLEVIAEQAGVVEDDIAQLYDDWFIETCQDWLVPYIGDLVGYTPIFEAGQPGDPLQPREAARNRILMPRREVANTIRYRRRKGALALLEELARDVAGWRTRAVEFYTLLGRTQNISHLRLGRGRTVDVRDGDVLDRLGGAFDELAHTVDVRRIESVGRPGRFNISSVGLFIWRLQSYSVTGTQATGIEGRPNLFTFSTLGNDTPLFVRPEPEADPNHIAGELNVPEPIRRRAFADGTRASAEYYGARRSVAICVDEWEGWPEGGLVPRERIVPADLSGWHYEPRPGTIAVDPVRGRIAFPREEVPWRGIRVSVDYHYGFPADIGGGEYIRPIEQREDAVVYRVDVDCEDQGNNCFTSIQDALKAWSTEKPRHGVVELSESLVYTERIEPVELTIPGQSLQVRAAQGKRPILRLLNYRADRPDALTFRLAKGCMLELDGLLITGNAVTIEEYHEPPAKPASRGRQAGQPQQTAPAVDVPPCLPDQGEVIIRHTTLVPGWTLDVECAPERATEPSLVVDRANVRLSVEHSIIGSVMINLDEVKLEPVPVRITDSILDATGVDCRRPECVAISDGELSYAHAVLTIQRSTVIGRVLVHAVELGENTIFYSPLRVARSQYGCLRFSYVTTPGSRTPRRVSCQPDLVQQTLTEAADWSALPAGDRAARQTGEAQRVRPLFNSVRYGTNTYCQLALTCAPEITGGADDESEMGVYHDLYQPQRAANLRARLAEYSPAGMEAGLIFIS